MKLLASILLILSCAALAAANTYTAFALSVNNVVRVRDNVYTAEKNTVDTHGERSAGDVVSHYITFKTEGCKHVPGKDASAIFFTTLDGNAKILFSDGPSCVIDVMESGNDKASAAADTALIK